MGGKCMPNVLFPLYLIRFVRTFEYLLFTISFSSIEGNFLGATKDIDPIPPARGCPSTEFLEYSKCPIKRHPLFTLNAEACYLRIKE
jgi:hypothetical protein